MQRAELENPFHPPCSRPSRQVRVIRVIRGSYSGFRVNKFNAEQNSFYSIRLCLLCFLVADLNLTSEAVEQEETEGTEAQADKNLVAGLFLIGWWMIQAVPSLLSLFPPVNPTSVFGINAFLEFSQNSVLRIHA